MTMSKPENIFCRVCGREFTIDNAPWNDDEMPSHEICPCCGVQFGYEDDIYAGVNDYRNQWLNGGAKWFSPGLRPKDWILEAQLKNISER
jgi:CRISPR/Cas system-associated protein Cas10 (large subunit of type III CRISPR-Cas system)